MQPLVAALHTFEYVLDDPHSAATVRLETGDLLVTDNRRVLHGRAAVCFASKRRHVKRLKMTVPSTLDTSNAGRSSARN